MNRAAAALERMWFRHMVEVQEPEGRTAFGTVMGRSVTVNSGVEATARVVVNNEGREVTAAATLRWAPDGPLPAPGWKITLPPEFGLKPERQVITARLNATNTGLTPDHVEVTIQ